MTKHLLSLGALAAVLAFAGPTQACEMHQSHAALTTAQAAPAPKPDMKPVTVVRTQMEEPAEAAVMSMSSDSEGGFMGCHRRAKEQTVYLTQ
jgi:hypothetical protein